jgi:hypothetical protein
MSYYKDLYIAELERIAADLEARGVPPEQAYNIAGEVAYHTRRDRWADYLNTAHKRWADYLDAARRQQNLDEPEGIFRDKPKDDPND